MFTRILPRWNILQSIGKVVHLSSEKFLLEGVRHSGMLSSPASEWEINCTAVRFIIINYHYFTFMSIFDMI